MKNTILGLTSFDIADKLSKAGSLVFGWDSEWAEDFDINRNKYGGIEAFEKLLVENPRCQFHQHLTRGFYICTSQKRKKDSHVIYIFCRFWDLLS